MDQTEIISIYETGYFESDEEAQAILQRYATQGPVLFLPEFEVIQDVARRLTDAAYKDGGLTPREILTAYQRLRKSHSQTDMWCLLPDEYDSSLSCGGKVELGIDAAGAYYYCKKEPRKHIFPYPLSGQSRPNP